MTLETIVFEGFSMPKANNQLETTLITTNHVRTIIALYSIKNKTSKIFMYIFPYLSPKCKINITGKRNFSKSLLFRNRIYNVSVIYRRKNAQSNTKAKKEAIELYYFLLFLPSISRLLATLTIAGFSNLSCMV